MSQPDSNKYTQPEPQQGVVQPMTQPSRADLLLMAKLFSLGADGAWVREVDAPTSEPARRAIHNWVRKGYAHYTQDPDMLILNDSCARMCGEALTAAFDVRMERSMRDMKKRKHRGLSPLMRGAAAVLTAVILGILVAMVTALW